MKMCKKIVSCVMSLVIVASSVIITKSGIMNTQAAVSWKLIWSDEFNGTALDTSVWSYEIGNGKDGWGNWEVEYYTDRTDNVKVSNGSLQIIAKRENYGGKKYTSGRILTKGKKFFKYGKMEAKIKVENGNQDGVWPAYWMMGENMSQGVGWPRCGEIDIMEHANSNNYVGGCLHWNTNGLNGEYSHGSYGSGFEGAQNSFGYFTDNENNGINGWHTYTLIWDESHMEWQLDGNTYLSQKITSNNAYCFQKEQFFLFNLAIGGTGTGFTNNKTANEATFKTTTMYVDYLRVYQQDDSGTVTEKPTSQQSTTQSQVPTKVTYEEVDSVAECDSVCGAYFGGANGWGTATGNISNASNTGFNIHMNSIGTELWQVQGYLRDLQYIAGNTYKYKCTITSDVTKSVRVKVVGNDDNFIFSQEDITVQAGVPYNYEKQVTIPDGYTGRLDLYFGLGKNNYVGEGLNSETAVNIQVSNMSFITQKKIVTEVPTSTQKDITTTAKQNPTTKRQTQTQTKAKLGKVKIKSVRRSNNNKKVKLIFRKVKGAHLYQIKYSTSSTFKKSKMKKTYYLTNTLKKLKAKKKYYIKIRAIRYNDDGTTSYGPWSNLKKIKIRKTKKK